MIEELNFLSQKIQVSMENWKVTLGFREIDEAAENMATMYNILNLIYNTAKCGIVGPWKAPLGDPCKNNLL